METSDSESSAPATPRVRAEPQGDDLVYRRRIGSFGVGGFLLVWIAGWSAGCAMLAWKLISEPTFEHALFATPFFAAWGFVASILLVQFFGREHLRLGPDGLQYRKTALIPLAQRTIPLDQIKSFSLESERSRDANDNTALGIKVITLGQPVTFASGLKREDRSQLARQFEHHLDSLSSRRIVTQPAEALLPNHHGTSGFALPEGSTLRLERDWDGLLVTRHDPFRLQAFAVVTFLNLFWNGIVGVFVWKAITELNPFLLLFLSLHILFGLLIFLGWFASLFAPFARHKWSFRPAEITSRFSVFGLGWTRRVEDPSPARVEFRKNGPKRSKNRTSKAASTTPLEEQPFSVAIVGQDGLDLIAVKNLTEGEARCLQAELTSIFRDALARSRATTNEPLSIPMEKTNPLWDKWLDDQPSETT